MLHLKYLNNFVFYTVPKVLGVIFLVQPLNATAQAEFFEMPQELIAVKEVSLIDTGQLHKQNTLFIKCPCAYQKYQSQYIQAKSLENSNLYHQAMVAYIKAAEFLEKIITDYGDETNSVDLCSLYEETGWLYKQGGHEEKAEEFFLKSIEFCYKIAEEYIEKQGVDSASQYVYKGEYLVTLINDRIHSHDFRELHRKIRQASPLVLEKTETEFKQEFQYFLQKQLPRTDYFFKNALKLELYALIYAVQGISELNRLAQKNAGYLYEQWADHERQQGHLLIAARFYEKAAWLCKKAGEKTTEVDCKRKAIESYTKCQEYLDQENQHKHLKDAHYFQKDINRLSYRSLGQKIIQGLEKVQENFLTPFYEKVNEILPK